MDLLNKWGAVLVPGCILWAGLVTYQLGLLISIILDIRVRLKNLEERDVAESHD